MGLSSLFVHRASRFTLLAVAGPGRPSCHPVPHPVLLSSLCYIAVKGISYLLCEHPVCRWCASVLVPLQYRVLPSHVGPETSSPPSTARWGRPEDEDPQPECKAPQCPRNPNQACDFHSPPLCWLRLDRRRRTTVATTRASSSGTTSAWSAAISAYKVAVRRTGVAAPRLRSCAPVAVPSPPMAVWPSWEKHTACCEKRLEELGGILRGFLEDFWSMHVKLSFGAAACLRGGGGTTPVT